MVVLICILGLMSGALAIAPTGPCVLVCSGIGSLCGVWILYAVCAGLLQVRLTSWLAGALLAGYCGGAFYSMLMALLGGIALTSYIGVEPGPIAYALILVMLACMALIVVGSMESPLIRERHIVEVSGRGERFLWIGLALVAYGYASGKLGYKGIGATTVGNKINVIASILLSITEILPALSAIGFLQSSGMRRLRFGAIVCAATLATFPVGRRVFTFSLVLAVFAALRFSGRSVRVSRGRKIVLAAAAAAIVVGASFLTIGMRLALPSAGNSRDVSKLFEAAERTTLTNPQAVFAAMNRNVDVRTSGLIQYLALLGRNGNNAAPLYGEDALLAVEQSLPRLGYSAVNMNKGPIIERGGEEDLANEHFGFLDEDMANSILTGGYIDFGVAGVLVYPLLLCALARALLSLVSVIFQAEGEVIAILYILSVLLEQEADLTGYLSSFRDLFVILAVWAALYYLPVLTRKTERAPAFSQ
jgi:hypothetical protein